MEKLEKNKLKIGNKLFKSRLIIGTGKLPAGEIMSEVIRSSGADMVTMALRRVDFNAKQSDNILRQIPDNITLLPNTSGARNASEAVRIANIARASGAGDFIKIEIINDMKYLLPDNNETLKATEILAKDGFFVLPYISPDPVAAARLHDAGASAVMPLGSPIGSGLGLRNLDMIKIIIEQSVLPVIVDAGIGAPSHAALAMESGADAVMINTAISGAADPVLMAAAFRLAVDAGRNGYIAGLIGKSSHANASSPLTGFLQKQE